MNKKIQKLAIANRGEVAVRILRACQEMNITPVLLHSEADIKTLAYRLADEKICIGPSPSKQSYLNIEANVDAAVKMNCDAIHPGFGFLSENADFAQACKKAGLKFVGPNAETIALLGDKISAKDLMIQAGVPVIPGYQGEDQDPGHLLDEAKKIGYPVLIKAAAGGGGRGMKVARSPETFHEALDSAKREALAAFGSESVFLEKYLENPKHIEFQIFGDSFGEVVHLFERECSVQRRHQKIIEEAPSPSLSKELREKMAKAAVKAAKEAHYIGAGTVEFLLQGEDFYFLEINTRLQVEHTVTEEVLNVDLVKAQIHVAQGEPLPFLQSDLKVQGHSLECRLYAEDPYRNSMPSTGKIYALEFPAGPGRRYEVGIEAGDEITSFYDPMIAKLIVRDEDRNSAIQKMRRVLKDSIIFGIHSNIPYLMKILEHLEFVNASMTTRFIETHFPEGLESQGLSAEEESLLKEVYQKLQSKKVSHESFSSPWDEDWRLV